MNPDTVAAIFFGGLSLFGIVAMVWISKKQDTVIESKKICPVKKKLEGLKTRVEKLEEIRK